MITVNAYAAKSPQAALESFHYSIEQLRSDDVEVNISHCGICHSDVHLIDNDWQLSQYPLVPGHEIIGHITRVGKNVTELSVGDRVGIGWQCHACLSCESCLQGEEAFCEKSLATANRHYGGFANYVFANQRFVFKIPDSLNSETAAPLLCGGVTVYTPFQAYDVRPAMRVGVIGIGGLGHLALQFARAWGCEVTAFSHSANKAKEAMDFGAHHFVATQNISELTALVKQFDFIISTVPGAIEWDTFLSLLRPKGKLCVVGVSPTVTFAGFSLLRGNHSICGSVIGHPLRIKEMLQFAARHQIKAKTQLMPLSRVNEAIDVVRKGNARYRVVLAV